MSTLIPSTPRSTASATSSSTVRCHGAIGGRRRRAVGAGRGVAALAPGSGPVVGARNCAAEEDRVAIAAEAGEHQVDARATGVRLVDHPPPDRARDAPVADRARVERAGAARGHGEQRHGRERRRLEIRRHRRVHLPVRQVAVQLRAASGRPGCGRRLEGGLRRRFARGSLRGRARLPEGSRPARPRRCRSRRTAARPRRPPAPRGARGRRRGGARTSRQG